jgi:hypothetical protein
MRSGRKIAKPLSISRYAALMKKSMRKIAIRRETLRVLAGTELLLAGGAGAEDPSVPAGGCVRMAGDTGAPNGGCVNFKV